MRIFLNGIGAFGLDVFNKLREAGEEIVAVAAPAKSLSGRPDRLSAAAEASGVPVFETARLGEAEVEAALKSQAPELGVMAFVQEFMSRRSSICRCTARSVPPFVAAPPPRPQLD
jgi:methionyl-tRNA formyltransferase